MIKIPPAYEVIEEVVADTFDAVCEMDKATIRDWLSECKLRQKEYPKQIANAYAQQSLLYAATLQNEQYLNALRILCIKNNGHVEKSYMKELAQSHGEWLDTVRSLPRPRMDWRDHFMICRSEHRANAHGSTFAGVVFTTATEDRGQCYVAELIPQSSNRPEQNIKAPFLFYSVDDAKVWCESQLNNLRAEKA